MRPFTRTPGRGQRFPRCRSSAAARAIQGNTHSPEERRCKCRARMSGRLSTPSVFCRGNQFTSVCSTPCPWPQAYLPCPRGCSETWQAEVRVPSSVQALCVSFVLLQPGLLQLWGTVLRVSRHLCLCVFCAWRGNNTGRCRIWWSLCL